ncbi:MULTISPECIES: hypothetical protein [Buttiauxella]|uniref:Uncharacterized protein n=1 Tax=Buttiauxella agrestis TaxID=82977 RepID=A0A381KPF9_9ENTR|nr:MULTISPECIES: hypothetical protein [Buttiauxella]TDX11961.1 hypothetical protein EDF88_4559 [Buttiauxella sp. BIGb0552]SUY92892.1 Uncharacterised protein [Buttiauxella agrestis]
MTDQSQLERTKNPVQVKKPATTKRVPRDVSNAPGMVTLLLTPTTPEFNYYLRKKENQVIKDLENVSRAITTLSHTVRPNRTPELSKMIDDWFESLHQENNVLRIELLKYIEELVEDPNDPFFKSVRFTPFSFDSFTLNCNHLNTMKFIRYIFDMNTAVGELYRKNLYGLVSHSQYQMMTNNILTSITITIDRINKTLRVKNRVEGKYSPDEFIEKLQKYKSVQQYIENEINQ